MTTFHWSPERLKKNLDEFARIGKDPNGGITRLSFSSEYDLAAARFSEMMRSAGLDVYRDPVGNVIGTKKGKRDGKVLMTGSHLDTVVQGGRYDGALGALAALEYACALEENNRLPENTIQIVGFAAEEGGPFGGTFGSRAMMGLVNLNDPELDVKLQDSGICAADIQAAEIDSENIAAFLELHIEQGDFLSTRNTRVGIVTGIVGITRAEITIVGESNHAGTTMMDTRRDAVAAFAELVLQANAIISSKQGIVGTFGVVDVQPNMANIIPGKVRTVLELRHMDRSVIGETLAQIEKAAGRIPTVDIHFKIQIDKPSCQCDTGIMECIESACTDLQIPYAKMASGAGHDANALASKVPVGMIFVPSIGGKSHCPEEKSEWEDIITGCQVYFNALLRLDQNIGDGSTALCRKMDI